MNRLRVFIELTGEAVIALWQNRLRSLLSVLGIAIGIAAVMTVSAVSSGGKLFVLKELETFGLRSLWVFRDYQDKNPQSRIRDSSGIDSRDLSLLKGACCPAVKRLSPVLLAANRPIVQNGNRYSSAQLKGVDANYTGINNDRLTMGRGFRPADIKGRRPVVLIGETVSQDLYPQSENPVGRDLRIGGRRYQVIGVLEYKSRDLLASIGSEGGEDANNRILLPYTLVQQMNGNQQVSYLQAEAVSIAKAEQAADQLRLTLQRRYRGSYQYTKITLASYLKTVDRILGGITAMGVVAASTALLVGGIGVAGIMSTAVVERIREIGVRMAIGANRRHILFQFLAEAVLISLLGGIAGLLFGFLLGGSLDLLTGFPLMPTLSGVLTGLIVSVLVGLASGYYPARRAAGFLPVEALRRE
ncbi:MAG: ABC transporter permease [Candidatus Thiodiazotropha lotti]|uniref:ABC transporter permease n=1 Tax=Candidatus Thiodiazotropha lotti TaxID=2792787 RepID=A0A9E4N2S5_9GAMM|nr:ABC transporter permease [Candidatus Thiodiazotropha lotti]MCG7922831.1 ABC transporter permease [Candidatus Thiodiazotropha lotti]MCG7941195.1 ABC transporter permease [Candidatus Thiodiazotropha lotti]MCG7986194.1 ABC transporter permease [Candidatus Thiodiazotropha lotti]MCG8005480.1 ABC transporter permease [Candidatus Thiodiazotropha lotti]